MRACSRRNSASSSADKRHVMSVASDDAISVLDRHPSLLVTERAGQLVAAHLRPAGQVALLRLFVELLPCLRRGTAGALALRHGRALLAERRTRLRRHARYGLLRPRSRLRLLDVALGSLHLLLRCHVVPYRPTARSSSALLIFDRPSMPFWRASL